MAHPTRPFNPIPITTTTATNTVESATAITTTTYTTTSTAKPEPLLEQAPVVPNRFNSVPPLKVTDPEIIPLTANLIIEPEQEPEVPNRFNSVPPLKVTDPEIIDVVPSVQCTTDDINTKSAENSGNSPNQCNAGPSATSNSQPDCELNPSCSWQKCNILSKQQLYHVCSNNPDAEYCNSETCTLPRHVLHKQANKCKKNGFVAVSESDKCSWNVMHYPAIKCGIVPMCASCKKKASMVVDDESKTRRASDCLYCCLNVNPETHKIVDTANKYINCDNKSANNHADLLNAIPSGYKVPTINSFEIPTLNNGYCYMGAKHYLIPVVPESTPANFVDSTLPTPAANSKPNGHGENHNNISGAPGPDALGFIGNHYNRHYKPSVMESVARIFDPTLNDRSRYPDYDPYYPYYDPYYEFNRPYIDGPRPHRHRHHPNLQRHPNHHPRPHNYGRYGSISGHQTNDANTQHSESTAVSDPQLIGNHEHQTVYGYNSSTPQPSASTRINCVVFKPPRLGSKNNYLQEEFNSRMPVPLPFYVDPRKPAPWVNPNLWWHTGVNLRKYKPSDESCNSQCAKPLALPRLLGPEYMIYTGKPYTSTGPDSNCCTTPSDRRCRCQAVDPDTGIGCIYVANNANDDCPGCQCAHFCSKEHAQFANRCLTKSVLTRDRTSPVSSVKQAYYCPETKTFWTQ